MIQFKTLFLNSYVNKNFAILQLIVPGYIIASVTAGAVSVAIAATVLTIYLKKSTNGELAQPYCYKGQEYCILLLILYKRRNMISHFKHS